jgi:hypothetical protein
MMHRLSESRFWRARAGETALALIRASVEKLEREWDHLTMLAPDYIKDREEARSLIAHYGALDELRALPQDDDVLF